MQISRVMILHDRSNGTWISNDWGVIIGRDMGWLQIVGLEYGECSNYQESDELEERLTD